MRSLSPKARFFIEAGLDQLQHPTLKNEWQNWARTHPFVRTGGFVNQAVDSLPRPLAEGVLSGLRALSKGIRDKIDNPATPARDAANLENDLSYIADIESELIRDLRAYA
jgi:hypothetical protein